MQTLDSFDLKDFNPFSSDDETPLAEYSNQNICEFEEVKEVKAKNNRTLDSDEDSQKEDPTYVSCKDEEYSTDPDDNSIKDEPKLKGKEKKDDDDNDAEDDRKFKCNLCNKKYKYARGLQEHSATHNQHSYRCPYCSAKFKIKSSVRRHIKKTHPNEVVRVCEITPKQQTIETDREDVRQFKCTLCGSKYKYVHGLREHMRIKHTEPNTFKCPFCPKEFERNKNIPRHIKRFHPKEFDEWKKTVDSNKLGRSSLGLNTIENEDDTVPNYQDYDGFIAKWKQELECYLCKNTFANFNLLSQHFKDKHPRNNCHIVCCEYKISSRNKLVEHIRLHLNPNAFKCKVCGKCSASSLFLKLHMQSHNEEKPFQCQVCQKRFRTKSYYLIHCGTHTSEKNLICTVCGRGFSTKHLLKKHEYNSHRYFKAKHLCEQCGKSCYSATNLKEHILKHAGIEEFKWACDECGIKFRASFSLKRHKKTYHNDESSTTYECKDCGKISSNKFNLYLHKKNVHGLKLNHERKFASVKLSRRQKNTHSGELRFQCPHCPVKFKHRKNIRRHIKVLHPTVLTEMVPIKTEITKQ